MLKEIVIVFRQRMGFRNGSQICLGNDNCVRSSRIWADVCTSLGRMMSFCDDLWSEPSSQVAECNVESATRDGYLLLASSVRQSPTTIIDNELKQGYFNSPSLVVKSL